MCATVEIRGSISVTSKTGPRQLRWRGIRERDREAPGEGRGEVEAFPAGLPGIFLAYYTRRYLPGARLHTPPTNFDLIECSVLGRH